MDIRCNEEFANFKIKLIFTKLKTKFIFKLTKNKQKINIGYLKALKYLRMSTATCFLLVVRVVEIAACRWPAKQLFPSKDQKTI